MRIAQGGSTLIEIIDNGHGIHPDDLPLAVMRHATSKIKTAEDLHAIVSLGFRGGNTCFYCSSFTIDFNQ